MSPQVKVIESNETREISVIMAVVAQDYGVQPEILSSPVRRVPFPEIRHIALALCSELTGASGWTISSCFNRTEPMLIHAVEKTKDRCAVSKPFKARFAAIRTKAVAALAEHRKKKVA